jgi:hypothetical protein
VSLCFRNRHISPASISLVYQAKESGRLFPKNGSTEISIHIGFQKIGSNTFERCEKLETVKIPQSVTEADDGGFAGCAALKLINNLDICIISISKLGDGVFVECLAIEKLTLEPFIASQLPSALGQETGISKFDRPPSVRRIGNECFQGCTTPPPFHFEPGSALTEISDRSLDGCVELSTLGLPHTITQIGDDAFRDCKHQETSDDRRNRE